MPRVDLIYSPDCPHVEPTRTHLRLAFALAGIAPRWVEHRIGDPGAPAHTRGYGSPTVLVDGRDVAGEPPSSEVTCRLYSTGTRVPSVDQIVDALRERAPEGV